MLNLNAEQIRAACNGEFLVPPLDTTVFSNAMKIDSRKIECCDLFIALKGENTDGFDYINDAINDRASIVVCEKDIKDDTRIIANDHAAAIIKVDNCKQSVRDIAVEWRKNILGKVIGITGSVGKTSTKNFIREALEIKYQTTANNGNYNNDLGLPITLCKASFEDDFVVTEMGMNASGEIANLCDIAQPEWGIITNVGSAHIEYLGSRENIAKAKSELAQALPDKIGKMFLWTDDEYRDFIIDYAKLKERGIETIFFGGTKLDKSLDAPQVWFENLKTNEDGTSEFTVFFKGFINSDADSFECKLNAPGKFNVINACAAFAVAMMAEIMPSKVIEVLKKLKPEHGRFEKLISKQGFSIINDAYNANPQSMIGSLETLASMKCGGKRIAFLGDMLELGNYTNEAHTQVGSVVAENKIDILICVGKSAKYIEAGAKENGMSEDCIYWFENIDDAKNKLLELVNVEDLVLFKASNSIGLQKVAEELAV